MKIIDIILSCWSVIVEKGNFEGLSKIFNQYNGRLLIVSVLS